MNVQDYPRNLLFGVLTQLYCRYHPSKQADKDFELTLATGKKIQVESHKGLPNLKDFQPNVYIPLTFEEVAFNNGDELREKAIKMVLVNDSAKKDIKWTFLLLFLSCVLVTIIWKRHSRRK